MTTTADTARKSIILFILFTAVFCLLSADYADARRMGGGRSFGSRKSFSKPAQKPAPSRETQDARQSTTQQTNKPRGFGGMLGGLLMGSLLGGLLFGGGLGGGNFLDLLLIGGGLFLLLRMLRSRRPATSGAGAYNTGAGPPLGRSAAGPSEAGGWGNLQAPPPPPDAAPQGVSVPADFDADEFLEGAKMAYTRLQESWDRRDLDDLATFVEPEVYQELANQAAEDPDPGKTEILMLEARLLEVKEQDGQTMATVYYDALLREDAEAGAPEQVREVWHFQRSSAGEKWKLAGIQQLED